MLATAGIPSRKALKAVSDIYLCESLAPSNIPVKIVYCSWSSN